MYLEGEAAFPQIIAFEAHLVAQRRESCYKWV